MDIKPDLNDLKLIVAGGGANTYSEYPGYHWGWFTITFRVTYDP